jgi:polyisoprenoid-binding protein YceI
VSPATIEWVRVLACAVLLGGAAPLAAQTLLIDSAGSSASFELRALWVKRIAGDFSQVEGVIERDVAAGHFSVDVRISADSVRMERASFATWARSPDFFDTARHPWIQFRAVQLPERLLFEGGAIEGQLSLRGITRTMRFMLQPAECPRPGTDCPVRAAGDVQRSEFGMDARRVVLGDKVQLNFAIRAIPATAPPPAETP